MVASTEDEGKELWISDGTETGTKLLKDIEVGNRDSYIYNFASAQNTVYFLASPTNGEAGLWKTDGSTEGTALVKSTDAGNIEGLHAFNNNLFFRFHVSDEYNLWKTDGTQAGTVMIKTLASTDEVVLFSRQVLLHDLF